VPDGYSRMLEHIAVHRYFMGLEQKRDISDDEAVAHGTTPCTCRSCRVIGSAAPLEEFPGRTEADLYLWVLDRQQFLHDHGRELAPPRKPRRNSCSSWSHSVPHPAVARETSASGRSGIRQSDREQLRSAQVLNHPLPSAGSFRFVHLLPPW